MPLARKSLPDESGFLSDEDSQIPEVHSALRRYCRSSLQFATGRIRRGGLVI